MDRANQPAELYLRHDVLDALKCLILSGTVVEKQQNSGQHLDNEQEQRDAAEEIPVRPAMDRNRFLAQGSKQFVPAEALVEPVVHFAKEAHARIPAGV